jgi:transcriptional antiterminator RfaH
MTISELQRSTNQRDLISCDIADASLQPKWLVATTHTHKETLAVANLRQQGYVPYCPMIQRTRSHARRKEQVLRPLFPGYIFVGFDPDSDRWTPIQSTRGIRSVLRFGSQLGLLDGAFVQAIKSRERDGIVAMPKPSFAAGEEVRLVSGPFDGLIGKILSVNTGGRLTVLMDLLWRSVRVQVKQENAVGVQA